MQAYSNPTREGDPYSLPDIEIFWDDAAVNKYDGEPRNFDSDGNPVEPGWYYWFCFPGCMPDSEPVGPYTTADEALQAARDECGE